jgi:hypothetical protein
LALRTRDVLFSFRFHPKVLEWTGLWSIPTYSRAVVDVARRLWQTTVDVSAISDGSVSINIEMDPDVSVADLVSQWSQHLNELRTEVEKRLEDTSDAIVLRFKFPPSVKVACEQYLLYFSEFLHDLDISANVQVREESGHVLFSVTPTSSRDALERIHEALGIYLQLSEEEISDAAGDIPSQKLAANIYHLRSQLHLARAIMQSQQATIDAQQLTIDIQQRFLQPSDASIAGQPASREEFAGGTVALVPYKGNGFEVDLPTLFRRMKKFLQR